MHVEGWCRPSVAGSRGPVTPRSAMGSKGQSRRGLAAHGSSSIGVVVGLRAPPRADARAEQMLRRSSLAAMAAPSSGEPALAWGQIRGHCGGLKGKPLCRDCCIAYRHRDGADPRMRRDHPGAGAAGAAGCAAGAGVGGEPSLAPSPQWHEAKHDFRPAPLPRDVDMIAPRPCRPGTEGLANLGIEWNARQEAF